MSYERLLKDNLIKKQRPDSKQIQSQLQRARKDLRTAESVLTVDVTWAFTIAYHAMIRASRALMYSKGFLPTAQRSHKTIIEFAELVLDRKYGGLISRFNRMRRRRHDFIYDAKNHLTLAEARSSIGTARELVEEVTSIIGREKAEKRLFD